MIEVMREARVPVAPAAVWLIVADPDRAPEWFDFSDRTEVLSGVGVGQKRTQHGHWGRKKSEVDQEIIAWEPPKLLAWKHTAERLDGKPAPKFAASTEFRIELSDDDGATIVRLRSLQEPAGAIKGWIMKRMGVKDVERALDRSLEQLTKLVTR
jgi:uncharacterized protein YndB with AHSA1/START domain